MRKAIITSAIILIVIGCIHIGFSVLEFQEITENALWFASGGLVFIFCGLFNIHVIMNSREGLSKIFLLQIANLLFAIFLLLLLCQLPMAPGFVGLACSIFLLLFNK